MHAGRRTGLDANVLSTFRRYAKEMEDLDASITIVHWSMLHKPLSDAEGGCKHGNLTWGQRKPNYDYITWEGAQVEAHEAVVANNETSPEETANDAGDMLGAAGTFANRYNDAWITGVLRRC
jgi:hypothetical protein